MNVFAASIDPWAIDESSFPRAASGAEKLRFLLRYALLAPSTRNTQPWKFRVSDEAVEIFIDPARWQRIADRDRRELYISIGCALENLLTAAAHFGYVAQVQYLTEGELAARVRLTPGGAPGSETGQRFAAIPHRHTHHGVYDGSAVVENDLDALRYLCREPGLSLVWCPDAATHAKIDALVLRADALLLSRPEYRQELADWIGTGAFGNPWLIATVGRFAVAHLMSVESFARADHKAIASSPALGVICAAQDTREAQIRTGQALERIYLDATAFGLCLQPVSQLLQAEETRHALADLLPACGVPLQPLRLGRAKVPKSHTPRRALQDMLV